MSSPEDFGPLEKAGLFCSSHKALPVAKVLSVLTAVFAAMIVLLLPEWPYADDWGYWPSAFVAITLAVVLTFAASQVGP